MPDKVNKIPERASKEQAISELSLLYTSGDFPKYNPDELLTRQGFRVYEQMARDEQVKAGLKFKRDAIISRGYFFELDHEKYGLSEEEATRRSNIYTCMLEEMEGTFEDALLNILTAMKFGFSVTEKITRDFLVQGKTYRGIKKLKKRPAHTFKFHVDQFGNVRYLKQDVAGLQKKLDPKNFIHYVMNPDVDEHYGESELRAVHRAWWSKDVIVKLRNIFLERHAGGFTVIRPPPNEKIIPGTPKHTDLMNLLRNINLQTGIVLPSDKYEIENIGNSGKGVAYDTAIDQCDMQIARGLLMPSMLGFSPQGDTGGYSQSQTHLEAFFWTLSTDANRLADALNEQLFRPLAMANFGDDYAPVFRWASLSKNKAMEIIKTFMDLVDKGVMSATKEDETFMREALELPSVKAITEEESAEELSQVQRDVIKSTLESVSAKHLTPEAAKIYIRASFPSLDDEFVNSLFDSMEVAPSENPGAGSDENQDADTQDIDKPETENQDPPTNEEEVEFSDDETIIAGRVHTIAMTAFKRAHSRVNFAWVKNMGEYIVDESTDFIAEITGDIFRQVIADAKKGGDLSENISENIAALKVHPKLNSKLQRSVTRFLKDAEKFGRGEAAKEIDKAAKKTLSRNVESVRLDLIAEDYFKLNSFRISGNITAEMLKLIEAEILNGAQYSKTWEEVEESIYQLAASKGLLSMEDARQALGEALNVESPDARLRTIVRTNTFSSINNARDAYFTDPSLGDFVKAYEYSAVLDSRTTDVCRHLEGDDAGNHSVSWYKNNPQFRPPNHYNCRSLLIAVTEVDFDEFEEGPEPKIQPQEGFR